jgi:hypothetical protein
MTITIIKHKNEQCNPEIPERCEFDHIIRLKYCDGVFYRVTGEEFNYTEEFNTEYQQDKYEIIHDIIAELFFNQLNGGEHAYTSSSSIAGHHNMIESGTLIFINGEPFYSWDLEESQINALDEWED